MQSMRLQYLAVMHQPPHFLRSRCDRRAHNHIHRFGRCQMVAYGADAAQPLHHHRCFPVGTALDEFLEAAKLDNVQAHLMHMVVLVQQQRYLAVSFDARHRLNRNAAQFSGWAAVSRLLLVSVIFDQPMSQFGRVARDEVGEEFPDGVGGRRAAGDEVIDFHHFMQRMHLVQRQRQLGIVRNVAVRQPRFGEVHLGEATAQVEMVALCGQSAVDRAGADGNEDFAVPAELAQHMHVFRIADAAFDDADVAGAAVFDVGDRRTVEFNQFEQR